MIEHKGIKTGGGRAYAPDMGGLTTGYTLWSWPTLSEAKKKHRVVSSVGGNSYPFEYGYKVFDVAGLYHGLCLHWCGGKDYCIEYRRYLQVGVRWLVPHQKYDFLEFSSEEDARRYLGMPSEYMELFSGYPNGIFDRSGKEYIPAGK